MRTAGPPPEGLSPEEQALWDRLDRSMAAALPRIRQEREQEEAIVQFLQDLVSQLPPEKIADLLAPLAVVDRTVESSRAPSRTPEA